MSKFTGTYDLEERTAKFAEAAIDLVRRLPQNSINNRMIAQLVAAAGSVGANYCEANEAESKKDFVHKIGICKKEIKECRHWIRLLSYANPSHQARFESLKVENQALLFIFVKISNSSRKSKVNS